MADQAAHFATIGLGAALFPAAYAAGLWGLLAEAGSPRRRAASARRWRSRAGFIACVWAGDYAVRALMSDLPPPDPASLPKGGRLIGRLERAMILMLVLAGQPTGSAS